MKVYKVQNKESLRSDKVKSVLRAYEQAKKDNGNGKEKGKLSKEERENFSEDDDEVYDMFYDKFERSYDKTSEEGKRKKACFKENLAKIRKANKEDKSFKMGITEFSDMCLEEFRSKVLMSSDVIKPILEELETNNSENTSFSQIKKSKTETISIDWSSYMGSARNQKTCGSCWAFATVGALEANFNYKYNQLYDFSEQYLVDCDTSYSGCDGGWQAFSYIKNNGINLESYYPYENKQNSSCEKTDEQIASVSSISSCSGCSFDTWISKLEMGPMLVVMDADSSDIQNYSSGTIDFETDDCNDVNHAVIAYGYQESSEKLSFRNSWGSSWGDDGDFHVKREDDNNKTCYLTKYAYRPEPIIFENCIIAYQHGLYQGTNYMMCSDDDTSEIPNRGTMSSVRLGKNTQVTLYDTDNCQGNSVTITEDTERFSTINFNDQTQSFAITSDSPPAGCVWMYYNFCFSGGYIEACENVQKFGVTYSSQGFNDQMSSIRIGSGITKITIYQHGSYSGSSLDLYSDAINLKVLGFDNMISSLKIFT